MSEISSTRRDVFSDRDYVKFIPIVVITADQIEKQGHDLVQMNTRRGLTDMTLRILSLQEQNDALRSQVSSMHQVQETPIINELPAARAVTFTPIAVNTLTTNYHSTEFFQKRQWCISATHGVQFIINNAVSFSIRGSSPTFSGEYFSSIINWFIYSYCKNLQQECHQ